MEFNQTNNNAGDVVNLTAKTAAETPAGRAGRAIRFLAWFDNPTYEGERCMLGWDAERRTYVIYEGLKVESMTIRDAAPGVLNMRIEPTEEFPSGPRCAVCGVALIKPAAPLLDDDPAPEVCAKCHDKLPKHRDGE